MKSIPADLKKVNIHIGGVCASHSPMVVRTVLGSCIAMCLFDPVSLLGGMNHFMLPSGGGDAGLPTRFGVHAMEMLINQLMQLGADRRRLQAKMFGGANVLDLQGSHLKVAEKNRRFAREFLETEGIPLVAQRVGGVEPLQVYFFTHTGKVWVKALRRDSVKQLLDQEDSYRVKVTAEALHSQANNVTLF